MRNYSNQFECYSPSSIILSNWELPVYMFEHVKWFSEIDPLFDFKKKGGGAMKGVRDYF